jgi:hypothetical protein
VLNLNGEWVLILMVMWRTRLLECMYCWSPKIYRPLWYRSSVQFSLSCYICSILSTHHNVSDLLGLRLLVWIAGHLMHLLRLHIH